VATVSSVIRAASTSLQHLRLSCVSHLLIVLLGDRLTLFADFPAQVIDLINELSILIHDIQVILSVDLVLLFKALLK